MSFIDPRCNTFCKLPWLALLLAAFLSCNRPQEKPSPAPSNIIEEFRRPADSQSESNSVPVVGVNASSPDSAPSQSTSESLSLFDGSTLNGWQVTSFGGEGECRVEKGAIILEPGFPLTGLTSTLKELPKTNYEISFEARKTDGIDFFCGLTFPVAETHCSLIVGGWAGSVVGLSMIDDQDANNNETRRLKKFELGRWYHIRLRVTPERIHAWIDDEKFVDQEIVGRRLSVRNETLPSRPLGICSFETRAEFREMKLKFLTDQKPSDNIKSRDASSLPEAIENDSRPK